MNVSNVSSLLVSEMSFWNCFVLFETDSTLSFQIQLHDLRQVMNQQPSQVYLFLLSAINHLLLQVASCTYAPQQWHKVAVLLFEGQL